MSNIYEDDKEEKATLNMKIDKTLMDGLNKLSAKYSTDNHKMPKTKIVSHLIRAHLEEQNML